MLSFLNLVMGVHAKYQSRKNDLAEQLVGLEKPSD
jgi:hypothetical protein